MATVAGLLKSPHGVKIEIRRPLGDIGQTDIHRGISTLRKGVKDKRFEFHGRLVT
jgi:hypothetical protein